MTDASCRFCRGLDQFRAMIEAAAGGLPAGGLLVADMPASVAVLSADQYYRGYTIVIAKSHATELFHLPEHESRQFLVDMQRVAHAIATAFTARKMNYELLGNTVPHLHWHIVPRYDWDKNPTRPIWEYQHQPVLLDSSGYEQVAATIREHLG